MKFLSNFNFGIKYLFLIFGNRVHSVLNLIEKLVVAEEIRKYKKEKTPELMKIVTQWSTCQKKFKFGLIASSIGC